jgi:hypothetical protein
MDRFEVARIAAQVDREVEAHNQSPETAANTFERHCFINNTANYHTGHTVHEVRSIQIASREDWNRFQEINWGNRFFVNPPPYIAQLLEHFDQGHGNAYGDLEVQLLREFNPEDGVIRAIFIIYVIPHRRFVDGHVVFTEYTSGDETHQAIREMFDENPYAVFDQLTENDILNLVANDHDAAHLMDEYFYYGFDSVRFEEEEDEYNQAQQLPPPPPPVDGLDMALLYLEELAQDQPVADEEFGENVIHYWLENEEHRQQLREIRAGRDRIQAQG